jgi:uncharacterized protein (DUF342 family)
MSIDNVNGEQKIKKDITWEELIEHSEAQIRACRERISKLRKSLTFFKKLAKEGVPFPTPSRSRQKGRN